MGILAKIMGDVVYHIRIFDNYNFIMSAEVPDKGQRYFRVTIHQEYFGLGEKTRLAFMLTPDIVPFNLEGGRVMEVNFDVRDACPLSDLLDVDPSLVYELNATYKLIDRVRNRGQDPDAMKTGAAGQGNAPPDPKVMNADFVVHTDESPAHPADDPLLDPEEKETEKQDPREDDRNNFDTLKRGAKDAVKLAEGLYRLKRPGDIDKQETLEKVLALCQTYPKLLHWLPARLEIEPEIHYLVSQTRVSRVGVSPSYFFAQSGAMISEKVLARPKEQTGWQDVAKLGVIILGIVATLGLVVYLIRG